MTITSPIFDGSGIRGLTLDELKENLRTRVEQSTDLGPTVSTGAHTLTGMLIDATAAELEEIYRMGEDIWASTDPAQAEGVQMDNILRLRGTVRNPARNSTATVTCTGVDTTVIAAGSKVAIPNDGAQWTTDEEVTIGATVSGEVDVTVTAVDTGPIDAAANSITDIIDGVAGWNAVTNDAAAALGEDVESDSDARIRSADVVSGSTTEPAVYSRLTELDTVEAAVATSNVGDETDENGTPPHSWWIIVYPDTVDPELIAETIWDEAGTSAGIQFRGEQTATVTAEDGEEKIIAWDWATPVDVWTRVEVTTDSDYPSDGDDLVEAAVVEYGATVRVGQDVSPAQIKKQILNDVPGIMTISVAIKKDSAPSSSDTDPLPIAVNEYGDINEDQINVISEDYS
ncbi:MAG: baseplate J/gp47 family protein [Phycisphaerales bacterium]|jgi:uncharacterized phage protein gp47/JayE